MDEATSRNFVTDVRVKRTIRDYLHQVEGKEILVREIADDNGIIQDGKTRALDFLVDENGNRLETGGKKKGKEGPSDKEIIRANVLKDCIDVRLFGATIPLENDSITLTGPVQFKLALSLNKTSLEFLKGTGAFASDSKSTKKTFREEYVVPYSLLNVYGLINENCAAHTGLTEEDVQLMLKALWNGTKGLHSRSKAGQMPRLLLRVEYQRPNFHIGELDKGIRLVTDKAEEDIRDVEEFKLDFSNWLDRVAKYKSDIRRVQYVIDDRIQFVDNPVETLRSWGISLEPASV
jgi:CRISPR-associated protein Csh2